VTPTPTLYACYFGSGAWDQYPRMARVLAATAAQHCPAWTIQIEALDPPRRRGHIPAGYVDNTHKLDRWCAIAEAAPDGTPLLLLDADTMVLRSLDPIWDQPFDLAYTVRPAWSRYPLNAGVIFLRVSDRTRAFLTAWREENGRMIADPDRHMPWRKRFGGMNQAALGAVLTSLAVASLALLPIPCAEWNCEDVTWSAFDPAVTRILHVKSQLRLAIFEGVSGMARWKPLVALWRAAERAALESVQ
jgi:hypothetical protein